MNQKKIKLSLRMIVLIFVSILVVPCLPLLISRRWDWWEAWVYAITYIVGFVVKPLVGGAAKPRHLGRTGKFHAEGKYQALG